MKKNILKLLFFLLMNIINGQSILSESDKNEIISVLKKQEKFWNKGDIEGFMQGYVKSDYLVFNGSKGPFYGWDSVKDRYIKTYPSKEEMGILNFKIQNISLITSNVAQLLGQFFLSYPKKKVSGYFTLVFIKSKGRWLILSDHTSKSE
mgnify:FL=1|tara:strand:+ start:148 stop:594 length:447 start_codon:yes stop_codon:yes gene_type:complete